MPRGVAFPREGDMADKIRLGLIGASGHLVGAFASAGTARASHRDRAVLDLGPCTDRHAVAAPGCSRRRAAASLENDMPNAAASSAAGRLAQLAVAELSPRLARSLTAAEFAAERKLLWQPRQRDDGRR